MTITEIRKYTQFDTLLKIFNEKDSKDIYENYLVNEFMPNYEDPNYKLLHSALGSENV